MDLKRLFFGIEAVAPWPEELPEGRRLLESDRHLTLAFLGERDPSSIDLDSFPIPPFSIGIGAIFDRPLFLPERSPRVAAWHAHFLELKEEFLEFQKKLVSWLDLKEKFLSHVTIARAPFSVREWKDRFQKLPVFFQNIHLYESLGYSRYKPIWTYPILSPFTEIEHTADIAFQIRGKSIGQLFLHAQLALSFHFPPLVSYFDFSEPTTLDEAISMLNGIISRADSEIGTPFKAVSFHGLLEQNQWEMIVDV